MTNSTEIDRVRAAISAFVAGRTSLTDLETLIGSGLSAGSFTRADAKIALRAAVEAGAVSSDTIARLLGQDAFAGSGEASTHADSVPVAGQTTGGVASPAEQNRYVYDGETRHRPLLAESAASRAAESCGGSMDGQVGGRPVQDDADVGRILNFKYRLERLLGHGGMGIVYLAQDLMGTERLAVKLIRPEFGGIPEVLRALRDEVVQTRKLRHENIVGVYGLEQDGTDPYIVMEYLEGKTLRGLLDEDYVRGFPFSSAWPIIRGVGAALAFAHDRGIVHSDLKPSNIFVTTAGQTKVIDFGIARAIRGPRAPQDEETPPLTPAYASCEMLAGEPPDFSDDVFGFACVVYEILSGKHPFAHMQTVEAREKHLVPHPIPGLSSAKNAALRRGLAFRKADRCESVEEFLRLIGPAEASPKWKVALAAGAGLTIAAFALWWTSRPPARIESSTVVLPATPVSPAPAPTTDSARPKLQPFSTFRDCDKYCPLMVVIPAGQYVMGSPTDEAGRRSDETARPVTFDKPVALGAYPVTRKEFDMFISDSGYKPSDACTNVTNRPKIRSPNFAAPGFKQTDDDPAVCVSADDARAYAAWINHKIDATVYRLPSEAEWEYAARAGEQVTQPWPQTTSSPCLYGNFGDASYLRGIHGSVATGEGCDDRYAFTSPVGSFPKSRWGLYDMVGNVMEWTETCVQSQPATPQGGSEMPTDCKKYRVIRGAGFATPLNPQNLRLARRTIPPPNMSATNEWGFRLARSL
jgi:formylglycine-generating enzyme required for sulfatase activity